MTGICEVCLRPFGPGDLEDGVTVSADCCERCGLCAHCREYGNHDCETAGTTPREGQEREMTRRRSAVEYVVVETMPEGDDVDRATFSDDRAALVIFESMLNAGCDVRIVRREAPRTHPRRSRYTGD